MTEDPKIGITWEEHRDRHIKLHKHMDELFADYINHHANDVSFTEMPIINLIKWSSDQCVDPLPTPGFTHKLGVKPSIVATINPQLLSRMRDLITRMIEIWDETPDYAINPNMLYDDDWSIEDEVGRILFKLEESDKE
jgi:hypothetical protein